MQSTSSNSEGPRYAGGEEKRARTHAEEEERKERLLTQGRASVTRSISDAVVIKDYNLFFLSERDGTVPLDAEHGFGLYYNDCRFLCGYELLLAGAKADGLVATAEGGSSALYELTNPDIRREDDQLIPKESLGIQIARAVDVEGAFMRETLELVNYGGAAVELPLSQTFRATFEDVLSIRGLLATQPGTLHKAMRNGSTLTFSYDGADGVRRELAITADPQPSSTSEQGHTYLIHLEPDERKQIELQFYIREQRPEDPAGMKGRPASKKSSGEVRFESDSVLLNRVAQASFRDLEVLHSTLGGHDYYAAGVPWFVTLFGRDSIITAYQMLAFNPEIAAHTLRLLASLQGKKVDDWRDEQPGKILHELRIGELARSGELPHTPYYGSVDATPLFLMLLGEYARWTGDTSLFSELRENVERALSWMDEYGDSDGDGYIEYQSTSEKGLINQGWKDSGDAIVVATGKLAEPPIALIEVQGYAYAAKRAMADLFERNADVGRAESLRAAAATLKERFNKDFWSDELGTYILALQKDKRPAAVVSSNAGHALWCQIAEPGLARRTAERLLQPDMFSGWGIRTLSTAARRYNPVSYHLGTVWPHDNAIIAAGFRKYGMADRSLEVFQSIVNAASYYEPYRLPELLAGHSAADYGVPVRYPVACHPQAWAAGSIPFLLTSTLDLQPDALTKQLRIVRPAMPGLVHSVTMRDIRVGPASVDLLFERTTDGTFSTKVLRQEGELEIVVDPVKAAGQ